MRGAYVINKYWKNALLNDELNIESAVDYELKHP